MEDRSCDGLPARGDKRSPFSQYCHEACGSPRWKRQTAGAPSGAGDSEKAAGKFLDNDDLTKLVILPLTVSGIEGKQIFEFVKLLRREDFIINEE